jgi:cytochrome P450
MGQHPAGAPAQLSLVDPDLYAHGDPHALWRWLRANDPVSWHQPADLPGFWALTRYDDVRAVYRDPETFSSAGGILLRPAALGPDPGGGRTLALTDPPRHRRLRALVDGWFSVRLVRGLDADMRQVASDVIDRAIERERCDFVTDIAARIPLFVICKLMGVPRTDWEPVFALTSRAFGSGDALDRRVAHLEILSYFDELRRDRDRAPREDLVSVLATATVDGRPLTPDEVILNCDNLLVGGTENTRIAASGGMLALLENPGQWRALSEDPGLLPSAVEEVLRWTSSATHIMRTAVRTVEIGGRRIQAGDRVTLWNPSANRDEAVFADPDRFDIRRQPNRHLALGAGEHYCLGVALARAELRLLYDELLLRDARVELDGEPVRLRSIVVNGLESLPVRLVPEPSPM